VLSADLSQVLDRHLHRPANVIATSFIVAYAANVVLVKRYPEFFKNFIYVVRYVLPIALSFTG
jgi:hypothetical protein